MSEQSRKVIREADLDLEKARRYVDDAATKIRKAGDGGLSTKIEKISTDLGDARQVIKKNTDTQQS